MIASFSSPSKLEGVAAARRPGACVHQIPRRGESLFAPTEYTIPPPIGTVGANHHSPPNPRLLGESQPRRGDRF